MLRGIPLSLARCRDVIDVAWAWHIRRNGASGPPSPVGFFANVSQEVSRKDWGSAPSLCRGTWAYSFEGDFLFTGPDHLASLGFSSSVAYASGITDSELRDLAGEGFALPCVIAVLYAWFLNGLAPWWQAANTA